MAEIGKGENASLAVSREVIQKDIDGLPLKDHQKVDLRAILGHFPEVDDEEPEVEDTRQVWIQLEDSLTKEGCAVENEDEEMDDAEDCPVPRQRRSSLRTSQHYDPPDSSTVENKAVRFADSLGLGLEAIRDVGDDESPPEIPHSALSALRNRRRRAQSVKMVVLVPTFQSPEVDDVFLESLVARNVLLESCFVCSRELTVSGVVRVTNVSYEKTVSVRYTTDSWVTYRDIPANYVPNSNDGCTDRFVFIIHLPEGFGGDESNHLGHLQFAVSLHAGPETYWDNNCGENYVIDCVMRSREPSISGESKSPTDANCEPAISDSLEVNIDQ